MSLYLGLVSGVLVPVDILALPKHTSRDKGYQCGWAAGGLHADYPHVASQH